MDTKKSFFRTVEAHLGGSIIPEFETKTEVKYQKIAEILDFHKVSLPELNTAVIQGFEMATKAGPLMNEPMQSAIFILEDCQLDKEKAQETTLESMSQYGPLQGQIMSTVKNLCKQSFLNSDPRVVECFYKCSMQASPEVYGAVYNIIDMVRGKVIKEEI